MNSRFSNTQIAVAVGAAISAAAMMVLPTVASAAKVPGKYVAGDIHNHTTCSDGSISMQKLVQKVTDKTQESPWGLDWFVQAGHGGNGNRNCTLVEDASLQTPAYQGLNPQTSWVTSGVRVKGIVNPTGATAATRNMWRWQSVQEIQYPLIEYLNARLDKPLFLGIETVNPGHEHTSATVITGQVPSSVDTAPTDISIYSPLGNANALAQWEYCFDRNDSDTSRGNDLDNSPNPAVPPSPPNPPLLLTANDYDCTVPNSPNSIDPAYGWNASARKLIPAGSTGTGVRGHVKSVEAVKWMGAFHGNGSYFLPTHLERAGPFSPDGNQGFNIEHLRNFNNAAPDVAFGFETQPGHHASNQRGEYSVGRNTGFPGGTTDSVGGTTYGGTGVYGAVIGGVWDALLGEGRRFWFFASSDWHARGTFGPDDRRSTGDFYPGEYQRAYSMVRNGTDELRPQSIVDGMRSGNVWTTTGQLVDRLAFVACVSYPGIGARTNAFVENLALNAAVNNTDIEAAGCATMGEKLKVRPGAEIIVGVAVRDPSGSNYSPYTFNNPSLAQSGILQPINAPVLDHIDLIRGNVTGFKTPGSADYSGEWPRNLNWLKADGTTADLSAVPAGAKNTSAALFKTFNGTTWAPYVNAADGTTFAKMSYRIPANQVTSSQYVRLRGTNLPPAVPYETDGSGNPLADVYTNAVDRTRLAIPCTAIPSGPDAFDGCPAHLATALAPSPIAGLKAVSYDVAAWSDLWVYGNPIYVELAGSTVVAGVQ